MVTFLVSNRVQARTALPYLGRWLAEGGAAAVVGPPAALDDARAALGEERLRLVPLASLPRVWRWAGRFHRAAMVGRVDRGISRYFEGLVDAQEEASWPRRHGVRLVRRATGARLDSAAFNRSMARALGRWLENPLPTPFVVVVSRTAFPHLACGRGVRVATLIESWDHPFAHPAGYESEWVVPWNEAIGRDWVALQDAGAEVVPGYPMKLRYALTAPPLPEPAAPALTYASGTSSHERHSAHFAEERRLIAAFARGAAAAGWKLLVKPHPMAKPGDFAGLDVEVLGYREGANDYSLDDDYDRARLGELARTTRLINGWTTFGLDAAAAGRPVLQFRLADGAAWPHLADLYRGEHLQRYYLGGGDVLELGAPDEVPGQIERALRHGRAAAERTCDRLRRWLTSDPGPEAAVERVVCRLGAWVGGTEARCA
ncbi:MAG TPA: hypothetical protein VHM02_10375 [Thermoanaerobaculia bacterium]|nr:hypothetical protein [Thermoanaerobaculia bacterium]